MKEKRRPNTKKKKGNAVLQKCMMAIDEFVKIKSCLEDADGDQGGFRFVKKKSRKELRKEKRQLKKAKMKSHYEGKTSVFLAPADVENPEIKAKKLQVQNKIEKTRKEESKIFSSKPAPVPTGKSVSSPSKSSIKKGKKVNKLQESRKMALMEANEQEDRAIKKLERCLGFNKRKNKKSLPQSFVTDGLDYILGVLDSSSSVVGMHNNDDDDNYDMARENFKKLEEEDTAVSDKDEEAEHEIMSAGSDEEESGDDSVEEKSGAEEEESQVDVEEEEEMDDGNDELNDSNDANPDDESEEETIEAVSLDVEISMIIIILTSCMLRY